MRSAGKGEVLFLDSIVAGGTYSIVSTTGNTRGIRFAASPSSLVSPSSPPVLLHHLNQPDCLSLGGL